MILRNVLKKMAKGLFLFSDKAPTLYIKSLVMIKTIICLFFAFLLFYCKNDNTVKENEVYRYDRSRINYSIDINSLDDLYRISFILDNEKKNVSISEYNKINKKYRGATIELTEEQTQLFIKTVSDQLKFNNFFHRIEEVKGYDISFEMSFGGDHLISTYKDVLSFEKDVSRDFHQLVVLLHKEKLVSDFFKIEQYEEY